MGHMPKIGGLQNAAYFINKLSQQPDYPGTAFQPKIKLHGTNAGIRISSSDEVTAQSKSRDIAIGDDNFGFAAFVDTLPNDELARACFEAFGDIDGWDNVTLLGEWVGPGIQKGVAISQIPDKMFFVFGIKWEWSALGKDFKEFHYDSWQFWDMEAYFEKISERIIFLSPARAASHVDFRIDEEKKRFVDECNDFVAEIEAKCPVSADFGYDGIGEGAVYYPYYSGGYCPWEEFKELTFKVKGEKHATNKAGRPAKMKSQIAEGTHQFLDFHLTDARLAQALQETGGSLDNSNIGNMIKWVANDIMAECAQEIEDAGLEWKKDLSGPIAIRTRVWFQQKQKEI